MKIALFIPIKLNNQRFPGKNIIDLNGKVLCRYLFETVSQLKNIDKYVYCSDDSFKRYLIDDIKFKKRDKRLDGFEVKGLDIIDAFVKDVDADIYILTHVTQPFVKLKSFERALENVKSGKFDSAFSAIELQDYMWQDNKPLNYDPSNIVRTQDLKPILMETGAFYIFRKEVFEKYHRRVGLKPYICKIDQFEAIDIDTKEDFEFAKAAAMYLERNNE